MDWLDEIKTIYRMEQVFKPYGIEPVYFPREGRMSLRYPSGHKMSVIQSPIKGDDRYSMIFYDGQGNVIWTKDNTGVKTKLTAAEVKHNVLVTLALTKSRRRRSWAW